MKPQQGHRKSKYEQDVFDKAFLLILHELQQLGFAKNVKKVEEFLDIPTNTLYQVRNGSRGVPRQYREKVSKFFVDTYDVNPKVFENLNAKVFRHNPPMLENVDEEYQISNKGITSGTLAELTKLKAENQVLKAQLKEQSASDQVNASSAYATRQIAFQEVVLELLAGLAGTTFEEVFAKMRTRESDLLKAIGAGGSVYSYHR